jgi:hypothetical protein
LRAARVLMSKDPSKIRLCSECKRLVDASTLRPLARIQHAGGVRYACPKCFERVMALRKAVREAQACCQRMARTVTASKPVCIRRATPFPRMS